MRLIQLSDYRPAAGRSCAYRAAPGGRCGRFVLQQWSDPQYSAGRFDLLLEIGGVLKSWVIPRGPSLRPQEPRLAIQGDDCPLGCIDFEGAAPPDQHGGGAVLVWDGGYWSPECDPGPALHAGCLCFALDGRRLKGRWMLHRTAGGPAERSWLLTRRRGLRPFNSICSRQPC